MLLLAISCALIGAIVLGWAIIRGEWQERFPSAAEPRWRLILGVMVLISSSLLLVVALALPRLTPPMTQTASQPVALSGSIEPVSPFQELP
jgi:hypothetical protein